MVKYLDVDLYLEAAPKKRKYNYRYHQEQFQKRQELPEEQALESARIDALRLLERRPYSEKSLFLKLKEKGYREEVLDTLITMLREAKLLDDFSYGMAVVEQAFNGRGLYGKALYYELAKKGLNSELVAQICDEITYSEAKTKALEIAKQKLLTLSGLSPDKQYRRLLNFLARKGYPYSMCEATVKEICD